MREPDRPQFITKFFELKDWHHFARGSIKFGTLEGYRSGENAAVLGARLDPSEGIDSLNLNFSADVNPEWSIPGAFDFKDRVKGFSIHNTTVVYQDNDWAFCSSVGPYTPDLHAGILYPQPNGYPGNPKLLAYVVYDADRLIAALCDEIPRSKDFKASYNEPYLFTRAVRYTKKQTEIEGLDDIKAKEPGSTNSYLESVFQKPEMFATEREYRILLRLNAPQCAPMGAEAIYVLSSKVRDSIVEIGPGKP